MQTLAGFEEITGVIRFSRPEDARAWRAHRLALEDVEDLCGVFPDAMRLAPGTEGEALSSLAAAIGGFAEEGPTTFLHAFPPQDPDGQRSLPIAACALAAARFSASGALFFLGDGSFSIQLDGRGGYRLADTGPTSAPSLPTYREAVARLPRPAAPPPAATAPPAAAEERFVRLAGRARWPLDRRLYAPKAPVLRDRRLAGRVVPDELRARLGASWSAFEAPGGAVLVFEDEGQNRHRVRLWRGGACLEVEGPPMTFPFPHAFAEGRLFLGTSKELREVDLATGRSTCVCPLDCAGFQPGLAAAGPGLCVASAERLQILALPSLTERWSAVCRGGAYAGALDGGAWVAFGAMHGSQIVRVADPCETLALAPFCIDAAWDEDGRRWVNGHDPAGEGYRDPSTYELRLG